MHDEWRDIEICFISSEGKIKIVEGGKFLHKTNFPLSYGYPTVHLGKKCFFVHKLVATTFLSNPDKFSLVGHKNGNLTDNRASNLFWTKSLKLTKSKRVVKLVQTEAKKTENGKGEIIIQRSLKGILIKKWSSIAEASEFLGKKSINIEKNCAGITKTAFGFYWERVLE
jgi:hypothetical protein